VYIVRTVHYIHGPWRSKRIFAVLYVSIMGFTRCYKTTVFYIYIVNKHRLLLWPDLDTLCITSFQFHTHWASRKYVNKRWRKNLGHYFQKEWNNLQSSATTVRNVVKVNFSLWCYYEFAAESGSEILWQSISIQRSFRHGSNSCQWAGVLLHRVVCWPDGNFTRARLHSKPCNSWASTIQHHICKYGRHRRYTHLYSPKSVAHGFKKLN